MPRDVPLISPRKIDGLLSPAPPPQEEREKEQCMETPEKKQRGATELFGVRPLG
jgi:hypothetical protein